tara:strand:+ start:433 stop:597 length:165 start_codon:yes stop_codon:yes gene_type:complete
MKTYTIQDMLNFHTWCKNNNKTFTTTGTVEEWEEVECARLEKVYAKQQQFVDYR